MLVLSYLFLLAFSVPPKSLRAQQVSMTTCYLITVRAISKTDQDWGGRSEADHLPSTSETMGSIPSITKKKNKTKTKGTCSRAQGFTIHTFSPQVLSSQLGLRDSLLFPDQKCWPHWQSLTTSTMTMGTTHKHSVRMHTALSHTVVPPCLWRVCSKASWLKPRLVLNPIYTLFFLDIHIYNKV